MVEDRKIGVPPSLAVRDVEGLADQAPGFHWQRGIERSSVEDSGEFRLDLSLPRDPHEWEFRVIALLRDPSSVSDVVMWRSLPRTLLRSGVWDLGEIVFDREVLVKASIISGQPAENAIRWVLFTRNSDPSAATLTDPLDLSLDSWMPFQLSTFGDGTELTSFAPCEAYGKTAILVAHIGASWTLQGPMVLSNTNDYGEFCLLEYGRIAGRVVDSDGRTPDWFSVTIEFLGSKAEAGVMRRIAPGWERPIRDDEGGFMTCQLPPGFYRLTPVFPLNRMGYPLEVCLRAGDHLHVELIGKGH